MININDFPLIVNADDLGLRFSVNAAIIQCFKAGLINSSSLITNTSIFDETVAMIAGEKTIKNIGVHVNLMEFTPITSFNEPNFVDKLGNWKAAAVNNKFMLLKKNENKAFETEINAQIEKAFSAGLVPNHLDSHYHIHTLPAFYNLFIKAAIKYNLKLRVAQTFNEGNYISFLYRKWLNKIIKRKECAYTDLFEDVGHYIKSEKIGRRNFSVELMLHPDLDSSGNLTDHYHPQSMTQWLEFIKPKESIIS